jgi:hypothetical protein
MATIEKFITPVSGNWVCPDVLGTVKVECIGGGGAGGYISSSTGYKGGGGGGAYASSSFTLFKGVSYPYVVGNGGAGSSGGDGQNSSFNNTSVVAHRGTGALTSSFGATGGTVASSTGTIRYAGGNGGDGATPDGGGGGSAGWSTQTGTTAGTAPVAGAGSGDSGSGGMGSINNGSSDPQTGGTSGGGGGGAARDTIGTSFSGNGSPGMVQFTYTLNVTAKHHFCLIGQ